MIADSLISIPASDGQAVTYGGGYLANIAIKTTGGSTLNIYDGSDATGKLIVSITTSNAMLLPMISVERKFADGLYCQNTSGWVGSIGLG